MRYIIYENSNQQCHTQFGIIASESWNNEPASRIGVDELPLKVIKEVEVDSLEGAMGILFDHFNLGEYLPPSDVHNERE